MSEPGKEASAPEPTPVEKDPSGQTGSQVEALGEELRKSTKVEMGPRMLQWDIRYPGLYLAFITLNLLDLLITKMAIDQRGMDEANILAKGFLLHFGFPGFVIYKLFLTGMVIVLVEVISRKRPLWALALIVFGCAAIGSVVAWGGVHATGFMFGHGE